jgi:hypothetical protein
MLPDEEHVTIWIAGHRGPGAHHIAARREDASDGQCEDNEYEVHAIYGALSVADAARRANDFSRPIQQ